MITDPIQAMMGTVVRTVEDILTDCIVSLAQAGRKDRDKGITTIDDLRSDNAFLREENARLQEKTDAAKYVRDIQEKESRHLKQEVAVLTMQGVGQRKRVDSITDELLGLYRQEVEDLTNLDAVQTSYPDDGVGAD